MAAVGSRAAQLEQLHLHKYAEEAARQAQTVAKVSRQRSTEQACRDASPDQLNCTSEECTVTGVQGACSDNTLGSSRSMLRRTSNLFIYMLLYSIDHLIGALSGCDCPARPRRVPERLDKTWSNVYFMRCRLQLTARQRPLHSETGGGRSCCPASTAGRRHACRRLTSRLQSTLLCGTGR